MKFYIIHYNVVLLDIPFSTIVLLKTMLILKIYPDYAFGVFLLVIIVIINANNPTASVNANPNIAYLNVFFVSEVGART
jgi:hypothetical protein